MTNAFKIKTKEKTVTERVVSCFIRDMEENDGGGWSLEARLHGETVHIDFGGQVRVKHLPTLITLMETAVKEDTERNTEFGSPTYDFITYWDDEEADYRKDIEEYSKTEVGMDPRDFWIANGATVDEEQRSISVITLLRSSERYVAMEIGYPSVYFNASHLEGMLEFLKACYEAFKDKV